MVHVNVEQHTHCQHIMCLHLPAVARRSSAVGCHFLLKNNVIYEIEDLGWKQSNPWCAEKHVIVATRLSETFIHSTDTDGTLLCTSSSPLSLTLIVDLFPLLK